MEDFVTEAVKNMRRTEVSTTYAGHMRNRMRHAMIGLVDESGELTKMMLRADYYNQPISIPEYKDELGDILWYLCLAIDDLADAEDKLSQDVFWEILNINSAKLHVRYPEKYSDEQARTRNLDAEKTAVEIAAIQNIQKGATQK